MGIRGRKHSSVLWQLRNVLAWERSGCPAMLHQVIPCPDGDGAAAGWCQEKAVPGLGRTALFAYIFMKIEANSKEK